MQSSIRLVAGRNFLFGALAVLGFAPFNLWPFTILSFAMLIISIQGKTTKQAMLIGFVWGIGFYTAGINWLYSCLKTFGHLPAIGAILLLLLLISYLALYPTFFAYLSTKFLPPKHNAITFSIGIAVFWFISEWLRSTLISGFPWLLLGYSQTDGPLHPLAALIGVRGISFTLCLIAVALSYLWDALQKKHINITWTPLLFIAICFLSAHFFNTKLWVTEQEDKTTEFALIQGNIAQQKKWLPREKWPIINKYTELSTQHWDADIIVWPEAAIPAFESELPSYLEYLDKEAKRNNSALITGILDFMPSKRNYYNNVIVLGTNGNDKYISSHIPRYTKHQLTPFGEYVPLEPVFRFLSNIFDLPYSSFSRGQYKQKNLIAKGRTFATAMCYEIIFDKQVKDNVTIDTNFILTVSNDTWFGSSIGPLQHMQMAQMRVRELQKPLIRATNNGVTAVTDALGNITQQLPQFEENVLKAKVIPTYGKTPFNIYGYWLLIALVILYLIALCYLRIRNI